MDNDRAELHPSRWDPNVLHLGSADDCHTCGTAAPTPEEHQGNAGLGIAVGVLACLVFWAIAAWWWWS
ncbi:hypothetical protein LCGC14_0567990 [marine sediment metagenome]|uniref:Uncharacterized protein n=1 Tax=marine sediment metagenome TaxID=412755 RepID=A0A0F9RQB5_9ZZZZ